MTVVMVEHELSIMDEFCDPVIVMAEGRVLAEGTMAGAARQRRGRGGLPCRLSQRWRRARCAGRVAGISLRTATSRGLRRQPGPPRRLDRGRARRGGLDRRAQRLGQEHAAEERGRARRGPLGPRARRRPRRHRLAVGERRADRRRLRAAGRRRVRAADRPREPGDGRLSAQAARGSGRDRARARRVPAAGADARPPRRQAERRRAQDAGDGSRADAGAGAGRARRADGEPRADHRRAVLHGARLASSPRPGRRCSSSSSARRPCSRSPTAPTCSAAASCGWRARRRSSRRAASSSTRSSAGAAAGCRRRTGSRCAGRVRPRRSAARAPRARSGVGELRRRRRRGSRPARRRGPRRRGRSRVGGRRSRPRATTTGCTRVTMPCSRRRPARSAARARIRAARRGFS